MPWDGDGLTDQRHHVHLDFIIELPVDACLIQVRVRGSYRLLAVTKNTNLKTPPVYILDINRGCFGILNS